MTYRSYYYVVKDATKERKYKVVERLRDSQYVLGPFDTHDEAVKAMLKQERTDRIYVIVMVLTVALVGAVFFGG